MYSLRMSFWIVPGKLRRLYALFLSGDNIERQHRQNRAVHGHRNGDAVQRNAAEQNLHVLNRVHRHARFADVGEGARVVGVVTAMGGQVKSDRQTLLPAAMLRR